MATATYEPIATTTLGSAAASITFSSIAATWTDLRLVFAGTTTATGTFTLRINSDSGTNHSQTVLRGNGAAASSFRSTSSTLIYIGDQNDGNSTTIPTFITVDIFGYAGSTYKTMLHEMSADRNGSGNIYRTVNLWRSTAAISTLTVGIDSGNIAAGSIATLYGLKAA